MNVLLIGAEVINKGAEAMARTVCRELGNRLPGARFFVDGATPGTEELLRDTGCEIMPPSLPARGAWKPGRVARLLRTLVREPFRARAILKHPGAEVRCNILMECFAAVVDISGLAYSDDVTWPEVAGHGAMLMSRCRKRGIPYVLMPQSFGPFRPGGQIATWCREGFPSARLLYTRDSQSRRYVAELLGKDLADVRQMPDIAFGLGTAPKNVGEALLKSLGLGADGRPVVAMAPNMRVYERNAGYGAANKYVEWLSAIATDFLDQGVDVLAVPHELKPSRVEADDRMVCEFLRLSARSSRGTGRIASIVMNENALTIKSAVANCDLVIGSRFHAIVAALDSGVPAVAIGWSHKYVELLGDFGLQDYVLDYRSASLEELLTRVRSAWQGRNELAAKVQTLLPGVRRQVASVFDETASVLLGRDQ